MGVFMSFTKKQNQDIQNKISILKGEGYGQDQSVAIALDMFRRGTLPTTTYSPTKNRRQNLNRFRRQVARIKRNRKK
jgi:hypothetical protein